jgi:hypothetical protein
MGNVFHLPEVRAVGYIIEYTLADGHTDRSRLFRNDKYDKYNHIDTYMALMEDRTVTKVRTFRVMPDGTEKPSNFYMTHHLFLRYLMTMARSEDTKKMIQENLNILEANKEKQEVI